MVIGGDGVKIGGGVRVAFAGGGAVADQTGLTSALEVLSDRKVVNVVPVSERRYLTTSPARFPFIHCLLRRCCKSERRRICFRRISREFRQYLERGTIQALKREREGEEGNKEEGKQERESVCVCPSVSVRYECSL